MCHSPPPGAEISHQVKRRPDPRTHQKMWVRCSKCVNEKAHSNGLFVEDSTPDDPAFLKQVKSSDCIGFLHLAEYDRIQCPFQTFTSSVILWINYTSRRLEMDGWVKERNV